MTTVGTLETARCRCKIPDTYLDVISRCIQHPDPFSTDALIRQLWWQARRVRLCSRVVCRSHVGRWWLVCSWDDLPLLIAVDDRLLLGRMRWTPHQWSLATIHVLLLSRASVQRCAAAITLNDRLHSENTNVKMSQYISPKSCCRSAWRHKSLSRQNAADDDLL